MLKVGVIGVGRWGRNHVRVLRDLAREGLVDLAAVCDVDIAKAKAIAEKFAVPKAYGSVEEMVERESLDAVTIATPIDALASTARVAIEHGVHVLVEKPVATSTAEARELWKLAESKGVVAMPGFIMRFNPVVLELRKIAKGLPVVYFVFRRLSLRPPWAKRFPLVLDLTIHDLDLARFVSGSDEAEVLYATMSQAAGDGVILAILSVGDRLAVVHTDGISAAKVREIDIVAEGAFVRGDTDVLTVFVKTTEGQKLYNVRGEEALKEELRAFVKLAGGAEYAGAPTLRDAYMALELAEKIVELGSAAGRR